MIKRSSIFDYLINAMVIYGVMVISLSLFSVIFGEDAQKISSIFMLGNQGLAVETLMQFLFVAFMISGFKWLFFTDRIIKNLSGGCRSILMLLCIVALLAGCIIVFQWFPVDMVMPWLMFFGCFFMYATVSVGISVLKERSDNKKMQEALERLNGEDI